MQELESSHFIAYTTVPACYDCHLAGCLSAASIDQIPRAQLTLPLRSQRSLSAQSFPPTTPPSWLRIQVNSRLSGFFGSRVVERVEGVDAPFELPSSPAPHADASRLQPSHPGPPPAYSIFPLPPPRHNNPRAPPSDLLTTPPPSRHGNP